jgi:hypothetical protein
VSQRPSRRMRFHPRMLVLRAGVFQLTVSTSLLQTRRLIGRFGCPRSARRILLAGFGERRQACCRPRGTTRIGFGAREYGSHERRGEAAPPGPSFRAERMSGISESKDLVSDGPLPAHTRPRLLTRHSSSVVTGRGLRTGARSRTIPLLRCLERGSPNASAPRLNTRPQTVVNGSFQSPRKRSAPLDKRNFSDHGCKRSEWCTNTEAPA